MSPIYLIVLAQEHLAFRIPELEAVCSLFSKNFQEIWNRNFARRKETQNGEIDSKCFHEQTSPIVILKDLNEYQMKDLMSRSVFARNAYEIWGHGETYEELKSSLRSYPDALKKKFFDPESSFCMRVKAFGRKISLEEQLTKINLLEDVLPFQGKVDLECPRNEFHVIEDYGQHFGKKLEKPNFIYLGRCVAGGQRGLIQEYCVKKRKFIGNTSMDACLSFVMSNLAKVSRGDYVCDPFVGTGSLLIAAAHFGAFVTGGDINYNILHARGKSSRVGAGYRQKDETIRNSLMQYGLQNQYVDVILHDTAKNPWKKQSMFDAIITDPPYGIRESCRKIGGKVGDSKSDTEGLIHFPQSTAYHLDHVFTDLLEFAFLTLRPGGRLVFWIPIYKPDYSDDLLPQHPGLKIVYNCEQSLKKNTSRRLIVMEKLYEPIDYDDDGKNGLHRPSGLYDGHNAFRNKYFGL